MEISPYVAITSFVSQQLVTYAYKHESKFAWVNKKTVQLLSVVLSSLAAVLAAWASGSLDADLVTNLLMALWNMLAASGLSVAFYEWTKK